MSKNLIWLAIGGVVAYLLLTGKKASATKVEEPQKDSDRNSKEPRSQADCLRDEKFSPSQSEKEITLTKKDGTIEIVKQEAQPASCIKIRLGGYALPLPTDAPIGASKELLDAMEEVNKLSIGQIMGEYNNLVCKLVNVKIASTPEQSKKRAIRIRALTKVAFDRGVKLDCDINIKKFERNKYSPVYDGNIKRLATGIN